MERIAKAFCKAQKEFAPALKTNTNPHFKSKYVGLDGCVEAVIDALNNNGIALIQKPIDCDSGVKIETVFMHESGEILSGGVLHVPASKQDAQGYGSALTYARRYGLMAACGIAPEDDDGNAASKAKKSENVQAILDKPANPPPNPERMEELKEVAAQIVEFHINGLHEDMFVIYDNISDMGEREALWLLLKPNSDVRNKLKQIGEMKRKAA